MKRTADVMSLAGAVVAAVALIGLYVAKGADAESETSKNPFGSIVIPKSIFVEDARGKDPFFPNSARRQIRPAVPEETGPVGPASLVLLGITGPPEGRIALINNQTFAAGEENAVRIPGGDARVKCVEIRERSVIVTIQGGDEQFELHLPERTLPIVPEG